MTKNILGFVLIDAPHSALNNASEETGFTFASNDNPVKLIKRGNNFFPYVSGQAWRYWWRETLRERFSWDMSPITYKGKKTGENQQVFTSANPFKYPDDDVFGYMRALSSKGKKGKDGEKEEALKGTLTRLSPLKNSPLVSIYPQKPTIDYGVASRQAETQDADPAPHLHQFYSCVLKGIFSLDVTSVGIFIEGFKTGYKHLTPEQVAIIEDSVKASEAKQITNSSQLKVWQLPKLLRTKRIKETINALAHLNGGAKQTLHLTDVTPKFVILTIIEGGNHLFMNITNEDINKPIVNVSAIKQVLTDYKDNIISDIYIGRQEGFIDDIATKLNEIKIDGKNIQILSPKKAVEMFTSIIEQHIE